MNEIEEDSIVRIKIAIIYGKREVDGICKDGMMEKIYKDEDDTAHYYYMTEFLGTNFKDEQDVQSAAQRRRDVNSIFFEVQKLGHIVFAECSDTPRYKEGLFYIPKAISDRQKQTLKRFQKQLEKENYNITVLINLYRDQDGVLLGNQKAGNANVLDEFSNDGDLEL